MSRGKKSSSNNSKASNSDNRPVSPTSSPKKTKIISTKESSKSSFTLRMTPPKDMPNSPHRDYPPLFGNSLKGPVTGDASSDHDNDDYDATTIENTRYPYGDTTSEEETYDTTIATSDRATDVLMEGTDLTRSRKIESSPDISSTTSQTHTLVSSSSNDGTFEMENVPMKRAGSTRSRPFKSDPVISSTTFETHVLITGSSSAKDDAIFVMEDIPKRDPSPTFYPKRKKSLRHQKVSPLRHRRASSSPIGSASIKSPDDPSSASEVSDKKRDLTRHSHDPRPLPIEIPLTSMGLHDEETIPSQNPTNKKSNDSSLTGQKDSNDLPNNGPITTTTTTSSSSSTTTQNSTSNFNGYRGISNSRDWSHLPPPSNHLSFPSQFHEDFIQ